MRENPRVRRRASNGGERRRAVRSGARARTPDHTMAHGGKSADATVSWALGAHPRCEAVPRKFTSIAKALGWMYVTERTTLLHHHVYRTLARVIPGEVAFASSYLKSYEGTASVMWRAFAADVDRACTTPE